MTIETATLTRADAEDFLFEEAAMLDRWDLDAWLGLFAPDAAFEIPSTDLLEGDPTRHQHLVADDYDLIAARVKRLKSKYAHAENPRSRTVRNITNVRLDGTAGDAYRVHANFVIYRERDGYTDPYIGSYDHLLVVHDDRILFRRRRAILMYQDIRPSGRLSFVL